MPGKVYSLMGILYTHPRTCKFSPLMDERVDLVTVGIMLEAASEKLAASNVPRRDALLVFATQ
jgi:hypothetical protein